jgi:hypothetical protein
VEVRLGPYALDVATGFGPRIIGLRHEHGPPLFALLSPELGIAHETGFYRFHGGHRLWAGPENPSVTYAGDERDCLVSEDEQSVRISAPPDNAGLVKEIEVTADGSGLTVEHRLTAAAGTELTVAPWAITQLPLGGTALLTMQGAETAPLPDRSVVLWPYTNADDPRLRLGRTVMTVAAEAGPNLKVGIGPTPSRIGYFREGWLFVKAFVDDGGGEVPDFGAVHQVFVGAHFCELETVGGAVTVRSDGGARLTERWEAAAVRDVESAMDRLMAGGR